MTSHQVQVKVRAEGVQATNVGPDGERSDLGMELGIACVHGLGPRTDHKEKQAIQGQPDQLDQQKSGQTSKKAAILGGRARQRDRGPTVERCKSGARAVLSHRQST